MKTRISNVMAGLGAVALGLAFAPGSASAATIQSGGSQTVTAQTTVNNAMSITVTDLAFGTFGTKSDGSNTATGTVATNGTFSTTSAGGTAAVIDAGLGDHSASTITVTALPATKIYVDYGSVVNMKDASTGTYTLTVDNINDNLATPTTGTGGTSGSWIGGSNTEGNATTTAAGALTFNIGASFTTNATSTYPSDTYAGSFAVTLSY